MNRRHFLSLLPAPLMAQHMRVTAAPVSGIVQPVLTRSGGNLRRQTYLNENIISPASIRQNPPRLLFTMSMPGDLRGCEAQPLFVPSVTVADGSVHDLCICCSMSNNVWAFDANDGSPLWMVRLGNPINNTQAIDGYLINDHWGVLGTGVIDGTLLYAVAWTSPDGSVASASFHLYAVDLKDGSISGTPLLLPQALQRKQRASLTLTNVAGVKTIFIPWGTIQEFDPNAHGYVTAVDVANWKITTEWNVTGHGSRGGIWQSGQGLIADASGNLYMLTGNGDFDGVSNFSECFLRLGYNGDVLTPQAWFSPFTDASRGTADGWDDMDLGSAAPCVIPELDLAVLCGKDGIGYVASLSKLGKTMPGDFASGANYNQLLQKPLWYTYYNPNTGLAMPVNAASLNFLFANRTHNLHGGSIAFLTDTGWQVYAGGENGNFRAWSIDATGELRFLANSAEYASAQSPVPAGGMPGFMGCLSANGTKNGLLWVTCPDNNANTQVTTGRLLCYDAVNFGKYSDGAGSMPLLWSSGSLSFNKFCPPVVTGGRIYYPSFDGRILVFG